MPWADIRLQPGVNVEATPSLNQSGYTNSQYIRFKGGLAQKLGGWSKYYPNLIDGFPRQTHAWQDLAGNKRLVIGTTTDLGDITNGAYQNIAPQLLTTSPVINFATTIGSNVVTVVDTAVNGLAITDVVFFNTPITVGGVVLAGAYQVASILSATSYTVLAATNATATVAAPGGATPTFTTAIGSANVTVTLADHGLLAGDDIVFSLSTTVGGLTITGRYVVVSITSASAFVITATTTATSTAGPTAMNAGAPSFTYYISSGPQASGGVYGAGTYGGGTYGLGTTITGQAGTPTGAADWSLDNWGELLIANPEGGGVYYWGPASGFTNVQLVQQAPFYNSGAFVSIAQQMIITFGSTVSAVIGIYQDPLMVKWCDSENFFAWTPTATNQAGSFRIPTGSRCVGGAATPHQNLIWTDLDLWSMTYIGSQFVFSFNKIGSNCGLISKHAHAQLAGNVYWMGWQSFFMLSGNGVMELSCPVWDAVFQDLDIANASKCRAGSNTSFSEIWFFYPSKSGGLGICDKYVKYNTIEGVWDMGSMQRNTWMDVSILGGPVACTNSGLIYVHESGKDADNAPVNYYYETGWTFLDKGESIVFIDRIFPDFKWGDFNGSQNAAIQVTVKTVNYPGETPKSYGPFTVTKASQFISKRIRARQIMFHFEGNDMGSFSRLGLVRIRYCTDGRGV
jgi:hypothetical protein